MTMRVDPAIAAQRAADAAAVAAVVAHAPAAQATVPRSTWTGAVGGGGGPPTALPRGDLGPAPNLPFDAPKFKMPVLDEQDKDFDAGTAQKEEEMATRFVPGWHAEAEVERGGGR